MKEPLKLAECVPALEASATCQADGPLLAEGCGKLQGFKPTYRPETDKPRNRNGIAPHLREVINELVQGREPWPLFLHGEQGSGKTCAALCTIDAYGGWYLTLTELTELLIGAQQGSLSWSTGHKRTVIDIWKDWRSAHLAVLDEIGQRPEPSPFEYDVVKRALDEREGKPLIIVSNSSIDALCGQYDDRIGSRLAFGTVVELEGDRRLMRQLKVHVGG